MTSMFSLEFPIFLIILENFVIQYIYLSHCNNMMILVYNTLFIEKTHCNVYKTVSVRL